MAIKLASLFIKLGADSAELQTEFKKSKKAAQTWQKDIAVVGDRASKAFVGTNVAVTGITATFGQIFRSTAPLIDSLGKTADKLGATTEGLQAVRFAGEKAGLSISTVDKALENQTRRLAAAAKGMGQASGAITDLGLDAGTLAKLRPELALQNILAELEKIPNQTEKLKVAYDIFGRSAVGIVNLLSDSIVQSRSDIDAVGFSLSRIDVAKVEAANDAFADISLITKGLKQSITVSLAEPLALVAQQLFESAKQTGGLQVNIDNLVKTSLASVSAIARSAGGVLTFIDGKPELAAGGLIGYLFGGKLGFAAGTAVAASIESFSATFDFIKGKFDTSLNEVDKVVLAYDKVLARIKLLEAPGLGNLVIGREKELQSLQKQREEIEFMLVDWGEYDVIGSRAIGNVTALTGQLGQGMLAVADATALAANSFDTFKIGPEAITAPIIDAPELISMPIEEPESALLPETGEMAALMGEYQNYQDMRVESATAANALINDQMSGYFSQQQAQNQAFQKTWTSFNQAGAKDRFKIGVQEFGSALDTLGTFSKTWFKINKAVGIANAVVNIAEGISAALALPPPASFIAAAKTALVGAAQITKIKSTQYGSTGTAAPSVPSSSTGILTSAPATNNTTPEAPAAQENVTVHVYPALGASQAQIDESIKESVRRNIRDGLIIPDYQVVFN